jgi:CheY-like chemotaxis protein
MKRALPSVALIWMYQGEDSDERRKEVQSLDYPDFEVIEVGKARAWSRAVKMVPKHAEVCVFWIDDGKPVNKTFMREMIQPLTNRDLHAVMHYWSGNAFSIPRHMLGASSLTQDNPAAASPLHSRAGSDRCGRPYRRCSDRISADAFTEIILLDLHLPDMDVCELLARIHDDSRCRSIPVIVLTGSAPQRNPSVGHQRLHQQNSRRSYAGGPPRTVQTSDPDSNCFVTLSCSGGKSVASGW